VKKKGLKVVRRNEATLDSQGPLLPVPPVSGAEESWPPLFHPEDPESGHLAVGVSREWRDRLARAENILKLGAQGREINWPAIGQGITAAVAESKRVKDKDTGREIDAALGGYGVERTREMASEFIPVDPVLELLESLLELLIDSGDTATHARHVLALEGIDLDVLEDVLPPSIDRRSAARLGSRARQTLRHVIASTEPD
jgi:hypothetical protein